MRTSKIGLIVVGVAVLLFVLYFLDPIIRPIAIMLLWWFVGTAPILAPLIVVWRYRATWSIAATANRISRVIGFVFIGIGYLPIIWLVLTPQGRFDQMGLGALGIVIAAALGYGVAVVGALAVIVPTLVAKGKRVSTSPSSGGILQ